MTAMSSRRIVGASTPKQIGWLPPLVGFLAGVAALILGIHLGAVLLAGAGLAVASFAPLFGNTAFWHAVCRNRVAAFLPKNQTK